MCVCAADAKGTDSGSTRRTLTLPFGKLCVHKERAAFEINLQVGLLVVQTRWKSPVLQRQNSLDQARHARRCVQVSYVRFDGTNGAEVLLGGARAKRLCQGRNFDRIAQSCSGPMSLYVGNALW